MTYCTYFKLSINVLFMASCVVNSMHSSRKFIVNLLDGRRLDGVYLSQLRLRDDTAILDVIDRIDPPEIIMVGNDAAGILDHELNQPAPIDTRRLDESIVTVCDGDSQLPAIESSEADLKKRSETIIRGDKTTESTDTFSTTMAICR